MKFRAILASLVTAALLLVGANTAHAAEDIDIPRTVNGNNISLNVYKPATVNRVGTNGAGTFKFKVVIKSSMPPSNISDVTLSFGHGTWQRVAYLSKTAQSADRKTFVYEETVTLDKYTLNAYGNGTWYVKNPRAFISWKNASGGTDIHTIASVDATKTFETFTVTS